MLDLRKVGLLLLLLGFLLLLAPHILAFLTLTYTYVAFPLMSTHILGENDGFDLRNLTAQAAALNKNVNETTLVPKVIHQVRLGGLEMRPKWEEARNACIALHPDWQFQMWDDEAGNDFVKTHYPNLYQIYIHYPYEIQRSNILRYLVLHRHGGIYMDLDLRCRVPLDPFLDIPFLTPPANPTGVNNAFIVASPKNDFLQFLVDRIPRFNLRWGTPYVTNMFSTGCQFWSSMHAIYPHREQLVVLPQEYKLNGHVTTPLFEHLGASSWHQTDARMILALGKFIEAMKSSPLSFVLPLLLVATAVSGAAAFVIRRRRRRRGGGGVGRRVLRELRRRGRGRRGTLVVVVEEPSEDGDESDGVSLSEAGTAMSPRRSRSAGRVSWDAEKGFPL